MTERKVTLSRTTSETDISIELNIDGTGVYDITTGNGMLDHMLAQISRHGLLDLCIKAKGDTDVGWHHLVEDVGILLGRALKKAVGEASGITRMSHAVVPLDEALALVALDFGGRGYAILDLALSGDDLGDLSPSLIDHFFESLAREGGFNIHVRVMAGENNHHKAEAVFKALARSMRKALSKDDRLGGGIASTKGVIG